MKEKESFENFIQGKLREKDFQFEEKDWEKANSRISELRSIEKRKKKRIIWFTLFIISLVVVFVLAYKFIS